MNKASIAKLAWPLLQEPNWVRVLTAKYGSILLVHMAEHFLLDKWLEDAPLASCVVRPLDQAEPGKTIHDYWLQTNDWDWGVLRQYLPDATLPKLSGILSTAKLKTNFCGSTRLKGSFPLSKSTLSFCKERGLLWTKVVKQASSIEIDDKNPVES
ncbi:hypothetical protein DEO72_LG8g1829 [Vigna unguiculata]|uniref:Uncharacterized protein n=1 Tax=Vigna unguiculata TaxID=3917 RepID=A0A4D6MT46_VIGUN|nr:hypothetical protein DEO72_LG8g1829 [Vigna unguiculata]